MMSGPLQLLTSPRRKPGSRTFALDSGFRRNEDSRRIVILGSTGSIGVNALGVIERLGPGYQVVGLSAHGNTARLLEQAKRYQPEVIAVWDEWAAKDIRAKGLRARGKPLEVRSGMEGLSELAQWPSTPR